MPQELAPIRDDGPYSNRYLSHGALIAEAAELLTAMSIGLTPEGARKRIVSNTLLTQHSLANRQNILESLIHRLFGRQTEWVSKALVEASAQGPDSVELRGLLYLQYALRDRLTYEFITQVGWEHHRTNTPLTIPDGLAFLERAERDHAPVARWSEWTRVQLFDRILGALGELGFLRADASGRIEGVSLPPPVLRHLLRVLHAEGLRGGALFEDSAWRVLLLDAEQARARVEAEQEALGVRVDRGGDALEVPSVWW